MTTTLFYDGDCPLCSREIAHYRLKTAGLDSVQYVDIADPAFDAAAHGLDPVRVHKVMHVKAGDQVFTAVDAFIAIWKAVPGYGRMARLAAFPLVKPFLTLGYHAFALVRPWLPRSKRECDTGKCPV